MTLYLKYRPQKIEELDLKSVRESLQATLKNKNLPHAWLFSGSRGTGKTSAARILAKYINCEGPPSAKASEGRSKPCNECEMCEAITTGSAPDVIEIDAASNRGIDEIRELREKIGLAPMQAKFKVYIVDEAHMLTTEAANALLKTLEEPPAHAVFVLCTTEPEKLPETVVSRCTRVGFKKPSIAEIVEKLERVAKEEGLRITNNELREVAKAAKGSFRDAIKILEQAILVGGDVDKVIDNTDSEEFLEMGMDGALKFINKLVENGVNLRGFVEKCVEVLREKLLETKDVSLIGKIEGLEKAYVRMKDSAVQQLPLEIFVIENASSHVISTDSAKPKSGEILQVEVKIPEKKGSLGTARDDNGIQGKYKLDDMVGKWAEVMKAVRPKNHSVEALLRSTRPADFDGQDFVLEAFYEFHKKQLETEKCRMIVEAAVAQVFGVDKVVLKLILGSGGRLRQGFGESKEDNELVKAAQEIFK